MDKKWAALVPQRQLVGKSGKPLLSLTRGNGIRLIGRLPEEAYVRIYAHIGLSDIVNLASCCRKLAALSSDERVWSVKLALLEWSGEDPPEAKKIRARQDETKRQSALFAASSSSPSSSSPAAAIAGPSNNSSASHTRRQSSVSDVSTPTTTTTPTTAKRTSFSSSANDSTSKTSTGNLNSTSTPSYSSFSPSTPRASTSSASASASTPTHHLERKKSTSSQSDAIAAAADNDDDDDGFGDFVDFNTGAVNGSINSHGPNSTGGHRTSADLFGAALNDGFSTISLDAQPLQPTKASSSTSTSTSTSNLKTSIASTPRPIRKSEDLLMLFDDETDDMGLASVSPPRPTFPSKIIASTYNSSFNALDRRKSLQDGQPSVASTGNGPSTTTTTATSSFSKHASPALSRDLFRAYFQFLVPYYVSLQYQNTSSLVFTQPALTDISRAHILSNLKRLLQPSIAPTQYTKRLLTVHRNLQSSIDYFEASMLASFEKATDRRIQRDMREAAHAAYALNGGASVIQIFINKIALFNDQSWDPLSNLTKTMDMSGQLVDGIDFSAMDEFMDHVQGVVTKEGTIIARVFPPDSDALVYFTDRLASDVLSDYILDLLNAARDLPKPLFLLTTAATFGQCQRLIETVLSIEPRSARVTDESISQSVYKMFEPHVPAYLKQEGEWCRKYLEEICVEWERKLAEERASRDPTFLSTANPQQAKRNVLAGFTKALLLPVTIVPKTVAFSVNAITQGGTMAFNAMSGGLGSSSTAAASASGVSTSKAITSAVKEVETPTTLSANGSATALNFHGENFQSLISIETAMQLIQADRECLKRVQTFIGYSGTVGLKVKRVIEEIFIILCQTVSSSHLTPAFAKATDQMGAYKPADHAVDQSVAPLVQFFELVHIGDTILQMVQVYYDREMIKYVDKNDFLSNIVREKKKFENALDESVASGLNAGVNILMTQAEYILTTQQDATDFCPELRNSEKEKGQVSIITAKHAVVDIEGPSKAAEAVVDCLRSHCQMLRGSTDKAILEVFHQEVGLRLHGMLLKHLKKSIVSVSGGFQVIADLNLYTSFVSSLKLPTVNPYFSALKMAANVFIIDSPRDLGVMARDLDRYEGTLRIEDIMEMVQCRTDWKKIEREVEKEVFGFKTEDCIVS